MDISNDPAYVTIRDYVITEAAHQQTKEAYTAARKALLALVPKEIGENTLKVGDFTLTVKYPEKNVWDAEQLDALYGSDKPAHVKLSYSIDMSVLKRLPLPEQMTLQQCYEVKAGTPVIDIVSN